MQLKAGEGMDWLTAADVLVIPAAFILGRYSSRFRFIRVRRRYKQDVSQFIRGR